MINISSSKQLGIILPNTNTALKKVLENATPIELEALSKGKDLKSVMNTILKQSGDNASSNKELLQLVKNNPTLKNLGEVTTTIKDLLSSLKSDKEPLPIEKTLKNFLTDIKDLKNTELKQKLENSGVLLESKLKNAQNPQVELKNTLISLEKTLQASPSSKVIANEVKLLLNTEVLKSAKATDIPQDIKTNPKVLAQLASKVDTLIAKLSTATKGADTIHNPALAKAIETLKYQIEPNTLTKQNINIDTIKNALQEVSLHVNKSFTMESKGILDSLSKILESLKGVDSLEKLLSKDIPKDITKLTQIINDVMQKADPLLSKDTALLLNKLQTLHTTQQLNPQNNVKEILANDLKAVLMQASEEFTKSSQPNQADIMRNIDKLSLQIDHQQLLSHLSNGTSLYLPFSWDILEDGTIELKKTDDENRFYCDIDLKLKEYGELNLKLTLFDKNQLNLHIYSANEEFKELMQENIPSLRSALIDTQITPREIRIYEPKILHVSSPYQNQEESIYMGFEVKA